MVWRELQRLRCRDMLQQRLLKMFDADTLECKIIQSPEFKTILNSWAQHMINTDNKRILPVPSSIKTEGLGHENPEVRWCVNRLLGENSVPASRGLPHFPSTLLQKGPKYPFEPHEYTILKQKVGALRGHELNRKIELPDVPQPPPAPEQEDMWLERLRDDDDLIDRRRMPYL